MPDVTVGDLVNRLLEFDQTLPVLAGDGGGLWSPVSIDIWLTEQFHGQAATAVGDKAHRFPSAKYGKALVIQPLED